MYIETSETNLYRKKAYWLVNDAALRNQIQKKNRIMYNKMPAKQRIFSAKNVTHHGFEPTTSCLPGRRTSNCAMVTKIY